jgi:hypothetical protein
MTVNAHFDGKTIVPDEPLDLPPNQALIVQIEPVGARETTGESALAWLALMQSKTTRCPRIWPINTTITSTAVPRTISNSGNVLGRHVLLDGAFAQARSVQSARGGMEPVRDPVQEHARHDGRGFYGGYAEARSPSRKGKKLAAEDRPRNSGR